MNPTMTPIYSTMLFKNIYKTVDEFIKDYKEIGFPSKISEDNARTVYFLLLANYGNNPIANKTIDQFKYKLFSIIFQYGPTWEKRLEIQDSLRSLSDAQLLEGSKQIYNHAFNDGGEPTEQKMDELPFINDQNTTNYKRSKMDAYGMLWELLKVDVTEGFIRQFKGLFKIFVRHEDPTLYCDEDCDEEVIDRYGYYGY